MEDTSASAVTTFEDDEHDSKECVLQRYFLQEWLHLKSLLDRIVSNAGLSQPPDVCRIRSIIDKYQEQGQLLEPYLETIVSPMMSIVRSRAAEAQSAASDDDEVLEIIKPLCIIIYSLVTVCGCKSVIRFFPHQVADLELCVSLLEKGQRAAPGTSLRQESTGEMEMKCVLLLWLYILVLIPFDLSSVDTSIGAEDGSGCLGGAQLPPLVLKILDISKGYLSTAGPMRRISGLLLSRLLTRPDMPNAFNSFIGWAHEILLSIAEDVADHFKLLGVVEALASMFKAGSRKSLFSVVITIWSDCSLLMKSAYATRSPLLRKFLVKLSQRIGLICLPPRVPSWRYLGQNRSLGEHIMRNTDIQSSSSLSGQHANRYDTIPDAECLNEEDMDVPEIVEEIIELLLSGLRDLDTVVRWSAAKGIGRITARLTSSLSEDVLSSVLELFSPGEGDGSWHGGCLALAELARRGLLLPVNFPKVVPVIIKALHYDIRRGPHSIGSHVRDAAAYVCWAFGRAYSISDMKGILEQLAPHLLTVACFDREVNCRRAASAAFQENVGRQGTFPHGIDIVNATDYFSLATRANSYLNVAVFISQYKEYLYPFVEELLGCKISHWDKSLRELAGKALSSLAKYDLDYFAGCVLDKLLPSTLSLDLCMRHGATLAAGELILTLHQCGFNFSTDKQKSLAGVVPAIEKARLYRGKGGEIMRSAVSRFIECLSLSEVSLSEKNKKCLLDALNENLKHPNAQIQCAAAEALRHFARIYLVSSGDKVTNDITLKYLEYLDDPNVAARRGGALALGRLPYELFAGRWKAVINRLCSACLIEDKPEDPDAEARVNAIRGLVSVCGTLIGASRIQDSEEEIYLYLLIKNEVIQTLFKALDDYSIDNRGDVGSWVREAAMDGLERCTYILCRRDSVGSMKISNVEHHVDLPVKVVALDPLYPLFDTNVSTNLVGGIAKQAVEKMDKLRDTAAKILQRILYNQHHSVLSIPHRDVLQDIIPCDTNLKWGDPAVSFPHLVQLLDLCCYRRSVLSGLVISIGGLQESLRKASMAALLEYIQVPGDTVGERNDRQHKLCTDLLWILEHYQKCDRIITPAFKTIEILLSKKAFVDMEGYSQDFGDAILSSLEIELKGSKDFTKLLTGLSILGYVASFTEPIRSRAVSQLLFFLGHRYPKIRKAAADQVYLVLLPNENLMAEDQMERALEILAEACWEGALEESKLARSQLYEIVGIETANTLTVTKTTMNKNGGKSVATDENACYSSLVDSSGF